MLAVVQAAGAASLTMAPHQEGGGIPGPGCEDGLVVDDGSYETAYGWVPSALWGEYVQTFHIADAGAVALESVCLCWTRTREDDSLDFEIEVYEDVDGWPAQEPLIVVQSAVDDVPAWTDGLFVEVPIGVDAPLLTPGTYHIGARWGPSVDPFFFICADQSNPDAAVPGFFRDDRSEGEWDSVLETTDPIFADHTAMLIRVRVQQVPATPALGPWGGGILGLVILGCAVLRLVSASSDSAAMRTL